MKWSDFERYLKGEHLQGRKPTVTIAKITVEETHAQAGRAEEKPVAYFRRSQKGLILSPTNQRALRAMFGDDVESAIGKRVQLEAVPLRVAGRDTLPIRINPAPQAQAPQQPTAKTAAAPDPAGFDEDLAADGRVKAGGGVADELKPHANSAAN